MATPPTIPVGEPAEFTASESVVFDIPPIDHPVYGHFSSDLWVYSYQFVSAATSLEKNGAAQAGGGWRVSLGWEETRDLKSDDGNPESLRWNAFCYRIGGGTGPTADVYMVRSGLILMWPNLYREKTGHRAWADEALELVNAEILKRLRQDVSAVSAQQRQVQREELRYLEALRGKYTREVTASRSGTFGTVIKWTLPDRSRL